MTQLSRPRPRHPQRLHANDQENNMTDQPSYEFLEDVPAQVMRVRCKDTIATRTADGRWRNQRGLIVPLDASGPWRAVR